MEVKNVKITDVNSEGLGVGRSENFSKVLFVKGAIMEEVVDVLVTKEEKNFAIGEVVKTISASKFKVTPKCQHFGMCGGCNLQHTSQEGQLMLKQKYTLDALKKIAKIEGVEVLPIAPSEKEFEYRNKMDFSFSNLSWIPSKEEANERRALGLHVMGRYDRVLDIKECLLHAPKINEIRNFIREFCVKENTTFWDAKNKQGFMRNVIFRTNFNGAIMVILIFGEKPGTLQANLCMALKTRFPKEISSLYWGVNKKDTDLIDDVKLYGFVGEDFQFEKMNDLTFKVSAKSFAQVNTQVAEALVLQVLEFGAFKASDVVYDLYSGIGTLSLPIAKLVKKVVGVEISKSSIADARENAEENKILNTTFFKGDVLELLTEGFVIENERPTVVVVDPPRAGLDAKVVNKILEIGAEKLIYVSCNPASFARDAMLLKAGYELKTVRTFDMFPQTTHAEIIGLFVKI